MEKVWRIFFVNSWWVWAFALICYTAYDFASLRQAHQLAKLEATIVEKQKELQEARVEGELLQRQLQSQSDPAWIEMVLMRELGMVPNGQTKVVFH
ncbi:MAG: hypothetical protein JSR80_03255 [Verrucomicrobia bacterium]|nr:hypothetical protein [Verrucomicrobiota bacterium]